MSLILVIRAILDAHHLGRCIWFLIRRCLGLMSHAENNLGVSGDFFVLIDKLSLTLLGIPLTWTTASHGLPAINTLTS